VLKRKNKMGSFANKEICPQCGGARLKRWDELTDEQKFLVERLPASAEYTKEERKKHRFCTRCWFEKDNRKAREV
jgi:Zn-finger nucleic acid-binding protein